MGCVELPEQLVFESLCVMVRAMAGHTKREFAGPLWLPLLVREGGTEGALFRGYYFGQFQLVQIQVDLLSFSKECKCLE